MILLIWVERLVALSLVVQTVELLRLREIYSDRGIWSWRVVSAEFDFLPTFVRKSLALFLKSPHFTFLLVFRLLLALALGAFPQLCPALVPATLFATTLLISIRWRGTFNGGSDFMTLSVLLALCFAGGDRAMGCLWYIAIQTCTSYFLAGLAKLRAASWRDGRALGAFLNSSIYGPMPTFNPLLNLTLPRLALSWSILIFECTFPLALLNSNICAVYVAFAIAFHIGNSYAFGLNRFFFAWAATYPALYYCSLHNSLFT